MAQADDYESLPVSIDIDIVDEQGRKKKNYLLLFQDDDCVPQSVAEERQRFANSPASETGGVSLGKRWVIVKPGGIQIPMDENKELQHYRDDLTNNHIMTLSN